MPLYCRPQDDPVQAIRRAALAELSPQTFPEVLNFREGENRAFKALGKDLVVGTGAGVRFSWFMVDQNQAGYGKTTCCGGLE